jgi:hypothetical protein
MEQILSYLRLWYPKIKTALDKAIDNTKTQMKTNQTLKNFKYLITYLIPMVSDNVILGEKEN